VLCVERIGVESQWLVMVTLEEQLFQEILLARQRVYAAGSPTPLQALELLGLDAEVWVKREDLGPINAYKWRGAYNYLAAMDRRELAGGVVCASAGNHAQGVAMAAAMLDVSAKIFMPRSTPEMKQTAVWRHGAGKVEVVLTGDTYDQAAAAAVQEAVAGGMVFVHPYDDLAVMGGQGTLADEVVMSGRGDFTHAYLQIGGGGMAAATGCWLKRYYPGIRIVGVEGVDQASMRAAVRAGGPVDLDYLDVFCDGTAVRRAGDLTWQLCRDLVDEFVVVTNNEVCSAIRVLWEARRVIPEPAGAMGLAGLMRKLGEHKAGDRILVVLCGANMDFSQLGFIARHGGIGSQLRRFLRFQMPEQRGSLVQVLKGLPERVNVFDVQYGKTGERYSHPVIGLQAPAEDFASMEVYFRELGIAHEDVTSEADVDYRVINYSPELFAHPLFVHIEFPERPGAFLAFMEMVKDKVNLCYFNYAYSGERVGRALVGMEFADAGDRAEVQGRIAGYVGEVIRACREVTPETMRRIMGD